MVVAEYATSSLGAFRESLQYGLNSCFAHDQVKSAFVGREILLRVPGVSASHGFGLGIPSNLMDVGVDPVLALLTTVRGAEVNRYAKLD